MAVGVLAVLSMGLLGAGLYVLVSPVTRLWFPPLDDWSGDWVWPAVIGVGMAWAPGWPLAAWVVRRLQRQGLAARGLPLLAYAGVLWVWALAVWWLVLAHAPL